jgi:hypothetical protein
VIGQGQGQGPEFKTLIPQKKKKSIWMANLTHERISNTISHEGKANSNYKKTLICTVKMKKTYQELQRK